MTLGETIRKLRTEQGVSVAQLAKLSGVHENTISRFETNAGDCTTKVLRKMLKGLGYRLGVTRRV